jgi:hypothetical protein
MRGSCPILDSPPQRFRPLPERVSTLSAASFHPLTSTKSLFSNEVAEQDIEEHFLHDLRFYYQGNPQDRDETRKLKASNIAALGDRLIKEHKAFQDGRSAHEIGAMNTEVSHEEITTILQNDTLCLAKTVADRLGDRRATSLRGRPCS